MTGTTGAATGERRLGGHSTGSRRGAPDSLHPNLLSVGEGYQSDQESAHELEAQRFYNFHQRLTFAPVYAIGQGLLMKHLGHKKYQ